MKNDNGEKNSALIVERIKNALEFILIGFALGAILVWFVLSYTQLKPQSIDIGPIKFDIPQTTPQSYIVNTLMFDGFNEPGTYYGFDPNILICLQGCDTRKIFGRNNSVEFDVGNGDNIEVRSLYSWPYSQISFVQMSIDMSKYSGDDNGDIHLIIDTKLSQGTWQAFCGITGAGKSNTGIVYQCWTETLDSPQGENFLYMSNPITVNFNQKYVARIKLNPSIFELSFYLNDNQIGVYRSNNIEGLEFKSFRVGFGTGGMTGNRSLSASVDNIWVAQTP
jgi:hypothetical protein